MTERVGLVLSWPRLIRLEARFGNEVGFFVGRCVPKLKCFVGALKDANLSVARVAPKVADEFYLSADFKAWARAVKDRAGWKCQNCGRTGVRMFADHIVEVRDGGAKLDPRNGQCLCGSCHSAKTAAVRANRR